MTPPSYFIVGCGHFGSRAVKELLKKKPQPRITVVDGAETSIKGISSLPVEAITGEGVLCLDQLLSQGRVFDCIIPAVPFHFVFEFILAKAKPLGAKRVDVPSLAGLPNPIRGKTGDLYTSLADFLCPEDCPEPSACCFVTGKARRKPLYRIWMEIGGPFESKLIRSRQLGLGVGGLRQKELLDLLEEVRKRKPSDPPLLISTACRCHGVTSALSFGRSQ